MVTPETELAFLQEVLLGDKDAIDAVLILGEASQLMDDIIDGDKEFVPTNVAMTFLRMLTKLCTNPFYLTHVHALTPILYTATCDYLSATEMEKTDDDHAKNLAFVLRDNLVSVVIYIAGCIGGDLYGMAMTPKIREFYHDEKLKEYKGGLL
ncbi:TPA: hypothetical protein QB623_001297 [Pasteurella multocida]|nr:hypothetical protein [Pasteurella multocida]